MNRGLRPLRHRSFRYLMAGQLTSNVGDAVYAVALPWYVLADHGGPLLLGTVLAAYGLPRAAMILVGGHAMDRFKAWNVMMVADAGRAVTAGGLAIAAASGPARAAVLIPIAIVLGTGEGLFLPGQFAIAPSLVPDEDLQAANALTSSGLQVATLLGPVLGGVLVATIGPAPAFGLDAASFVASALTLLKIRTAQQGGSAQAAADGSPADKPGPGVWEIIRSDRLMQILIAITLAANLGSGGEGEVALPSLVHGRLHGTAGSYGATLAAFGGGALIGTLIAAASPSHKRPARVVSIGFLAQAVVMVAIPYLPNITTVAAGMACCGALNGFSNVLTITAFQRWTPPDQLGRLMSVLLLCSFGSFPLSVAAAGVVTRDFGPSPFFVFAGAALAVAILAGLSRREWRDFGGDARAAPALPS